MRTTRIWMPVLVALAIAALVFAAACGGDDDDGAEPTAGNETPAQETPGDAAGAPTIPEDAPTVSVGSIELAVGESGEVEIAVREFAAPGLGAWTFDITYDAAVASIPECEATPPPAVCNTEFAPNMVRFAGAAAQGLEGDTVVGTLTVLCEAEGSAELEMAIELIADATIGDPQEVPAHSESGEVTCTA
ncbi:MAG: cohesin domain-containing protein [Dehalococcoidia bacterium]